MKIVNSLFFAVAALVFAPLLQADHHLQPVDLTGVWQVEASTDGGARKLTWSFADKGGKLVGTSLDHEEGSERDFDRIVLKEKNVTLETDIEAQGRSGVIQIKAKETSPGKLEGKWNIQDDAGTEYASGEFSAKKEVQFAGEWVTIAERPDGSKNDALLKLTGNNSSLKGSLDGDLGSVQINTVTYRNEELRMAFDVEAEGASLDVVVEAKAEGSDNLVGVWIAKMDGSVVAEGKWTASRKPALAGKWNVVAGVPDNADYHGTLVLAAKDGKYTGSSQADNGDAQELSMVKTDGKSLEFAVPFEYEGNSGTITVKAKLQADGSLKGEWVLTGGDDDTEYARESWKAVKK